MELQEFDSSSSSSDEELFELVGAVQPARVFRERKSPFEMYSEAEFRSRYRFYKNTVGTIIDLVEDHISPMTLRTRSLSAAEQLLIALRFYATGAFQILVGDDYGVHKSTVCRIVQRVSIVLVKLRPHFVKMPETIIIIIIIISLFMPRYSVFAHVNQLDLSTYRRMQLKNSTKNNNRCTSNYN
jgi:hypothetical protein